MHTRHFRRCQGLHVSLPRINCAAAELEFGPEIGSSAYCTIHVDVTLRPDLDRVQIPATYPVALVSKLCGVWTQTKSTPAELARTLPLRPHTSSASGSSISSASAPRNCAPRAPSSARWSHESVSTMVG